jgi:hypothetical protein
MDDEFYITHCPLIQQINDDTCFRENVSSIKYNKRKYVLFPNLGENKPIIEALHTNVTVISGHKAILTCTFGGTTHDLSLSSSHQLIWIRQSFTPHNADSILAHNQDLLISDYRLSIQRTDIDYSLTIINVNIDDEGIYACEVNTQPPQKAFVHLYVQGKCMICFLIDSVSVFFSLSKCMIILCTCQNEIEISKRKSRFRHDARVYMFNVYSDCQS